MASKSNIYETLWNLDKKNHGCSVSACDLDGKTIDNKADIILDEQVYASGRDDVDLAKRPLFRTVNEDVFRRPTYVAFLKLLNNYIVNYRQEEELTPEEEEEFTKFIDVIMKTKVMETAFKYIKSLSDEKLSQKEFRKTIRRIWFELYTNFYNGIPIHYCSGFEHVFVGEGKYQPKSSSPYDVIGVVSGYHNWVKFYLDEHIRKVVNYQGFKYRLHGDVGVQNPNVVTLQMTWTHNDIYGNIIARLFKKIGGFFVGTSPELELAIGTVAYYENIYGVFDGDRRNISIDIEKYNLVLYRNILETGERGNHIRSFYPEYLGRSFDNLEMGVTVVIPVEAAFRNAGTVIIWQALPNPFGKDVKQEWVELKNMSKNKLNLLGWEIQDKVGRSEPLSGTLSPDEVKRFVLSHSSSSSMRLGNGGGSITLIDSLGKVISSTIYPNAPAGEVFKFFNG